MASITVYVCGKCKFETESIREKCPKCNSQMHRELRKIKVKDDEYTR